MHRAIKYTSCWRNTLTEVDRLRTIAIDMHLDKSRVDHIINCRISSLFSPRNCSTGKCFVRLPFVNAKRTSAIVNILKRVDIIPVFFSTKSIFSSLRVRESRLPSSLGASNLIYKYECNNCSYCYIGQTGRYLHARVSEHKRKNSQLMIAHSENCTTHLDSQYFTPIDFCKSKYERFVKEAYYIDTLKPALNSLLPASGRSLFLSL